MTLTTHLHYYYINFLGALREGKEIITSYPQKFKSKKRISQLTAILKLLCLPLSFYLAPHMTMLEQAFGLLALTTALILPCYKNNKHINAIIVPMALAFCIQSYCLGNWGYMAMTGIASVRYFIMALLPDDDQAKTLRFKIALFTIALSAIVMGYITLTIEIWAILTFIMISCGSLASCQINKNTFNAHIFLSGRKLFRRYLQPYRMEYTRCLCGKPCDIESSANLKRDKAKHQPITIILHLFSHNACICSTACCINHPIFNK